jgi:cardiolipin hydrolase
VSLDADEIDRLLGETLEDRRLSRSERKALKQVLAPMTRDETTRRQLRNRAFRLAIAALDTEASRTVVDWLHDVVKSMDDVAIPARPARIEEAYFSPGNDCAARIVRLVSEARERMEVCVFTITDNRIADSLLEAHSRGVAVRIVTDDQKARDPGSDVARLARAGIAVRHDHADAHMHHKYALADRRLLATGSFNWTRSASAENEENVVVTNAEGLVGAFAANFEALWERSS